MGRFLDAVCCAIKRYLPLYIRLFSERGIPILFTLDFYIPFPTFADHPSAAHDLSLGIDPNRFSFLDPLFLLLLESNR